MGFLEGFGGWGFGRSEGGGFARERLGGNVWDELHDCVEGVGRGKRGGGAKDISCFLNMVVFDTEKDAATVMSRRKGKTHDFFSKVAQPPSPYLLIRFDV